MSNTHEIGILTQKTKQKKGGREEGGGVKIRRVRRGGKRDRETTGIQGVREVGRGMGNGGGELIANLNDDTCHSHDP